MTPDAGPLGAPAPRRVGDTAERARPQRMRGRSSRTAVDRNRARPASRTPTIDFCGLLRRSDRRCRSVHRRSSRRTGTDACDRTVGAVRFASRLGTHRVDMAGHDPPLPEGVPRAWREPHPPRSPGAQAASSTSSLRHRPRPDDRAPRHSARRRPCDSRRTPGSSTFIDAITHSVHTRHAQRHRARAGGRERRPPHPARRPARARTSSPSSRTSRTRTPVRACTASSTRSTRRSTSTRQFEVPDSRRVFAVFEQPDLKATFQFTVTAPPTGRS